MPSREVVDGAKAMVGRLVRGKWRLDSLLGVGGSAAVFAATHRNGKRGALKILRPDRANDWNTRERFLREGYIANLVGHPGAVAMLDDDVDVDGSPFLVMELLEGSTLERLLRKRKTIPLRDVLRIGESVLDILAASHESGVIHGDIKPGNVFLTTASEVKLLDFGIARVNDARSERSTHAIGTPAYMAPEQARGEPIDARTDLWALGAVLYALITGKRPRHASSAAEELALAAQTPLAPLKTVAPFASRELCEVIDRALSFDRNARWNDATTMQQALRLALLLEQASTRVGGGIQVPWTPPEEDFGRIDPIVKPVDEALSGHLKAATPSPEATIRPLAASTVIEYEIQVEAEDELTRAERAPQRRRRAASGPPPLPAAARASSRPPPLPGSARVDEAAATLAKALSSIPRPPPSRPVRPLWRQVGEPDPIPLTAAEVLPPVVSHSTAPPSSGPSTTSRIALSVSTDRDSEHDVERERAPLSQRSARARARRRAKIVRRATSAVLFVAGMGLGLLIVGPLFEATSFLSDPTANASPNGQSDAGSVDATVSDASRR